MMAMNYSAKVRAAEHVLRYDYSRDVGDMKDAENFLVESLVAYKEPWSLLTTLTYHYANSMQTSQRKIPVPGGIRGGAGTNYLWSQLLPLYRRELTDFHSHVTELERGIKTAAASDSIPPWTTAQFKLISTNAGNSIASASTPRFSTTRIFVIQKLAPELNGLTGIRFSHEYCGQSGRLSAHRIYRDRTGCKCWSVISRAANPAETAKCRNPRKPPRKPMNAAVWTRSSKMPRQFLTARAWMCTRSISTPAGKSWS